MVGALIPETAKQLALRFRDNEIPAVAASLAFHLILALFPFLLALLSLLSTIGNPQLATIVLGYFQQLVPDSVYTLVASYMRPIISGENSAPGLFTFSILFTLWSASGAFSSLIRALNKAYGVEETRPFWKVRGMALLMTAGLSLMIVVGALLLILGPQIGRALASLFGLGPLFELVWSVVRWPVALLFLVVTVALLYYFAPNVDQRLRWIVPGGIFSVLLWVAASLAFSFYVANYGSYNRIYGSLGTVIVLLLYLYITSIILLLGAELNATLDHLRKPPANG